MNIAERVKSKILSKTAEANNRKIGVEIESFYYKNRGDLRIPVNHESEYSASDLLHDIGLITKESDEEYSYSLEPGGQLEWASAPHVSLWKIKEEYSKHIESQKLLCKKNNIGVGHFSVEPMSRPHDIKLINSNKYHLMNDRFKQTGDLGPWMMRNTTSLQLNIDYLNEKDANQMTFVADAIQPLASILFSNAPFKEGEMVGNQNLRWNIWNDTDASRCRTLFDHEIKTSNNLIDKYVDWLLSRKAIFLEDPIDTFIEFEDTLESMIKTNTDDRLIYSSFRQIFTHVRFKTVLEVRACDRQEKGNELAPAAFLSGLLTTEKVRDILMEELTSWTDSDRHCLSKSAQSVDFSNDGPKNKTIGYWLEYLCQLSLDGLDERSKILNIKNEKILLESKLKNLISQGTATRQIQDAYKKSGQTLKSFIRENYLDLYND
jgi:glutamate--cysteine ligase